MNPPCRTCGQGILVKKKKYRMSGPAVVIGYLLLIPSILGMILGCIFLLATGASAESTGSDIDSAARKRLTTAGIPNSVIEQIMRGTYTSSSAQEGITQEQKSIIQDTRLTLDAQKLGQGAGSVIFGGLSILIIVMSFIGGLLGWLLVMKKWVLQCNQCSAAVAAS